MTERHRWPRAVVRSRPRSGAPQTRACYPDEEGKVDRDGVGIAYETYGAGEPTILLMPTWTLVHSRVWKAQIPYLARHARVVTFDPRGNGRSDRPKNPADHTPAEYMADALAVLDATGTDRAVIVCLSKGTMSTLMLAAEHPDRVCGIVALGPMFGGNLSAALGYTLLRATFERRLPSFLRAWQAKFNAHYWQEDYRDFVESYIRAVFNEPHSTKQIEDAVGWGLETDAETLLATFRSESAVPTWRESRRVAARVRCPVLVINGERDLVSPPSFAKALARRTGGTLELLPGSGHGPMARNPVPVNLAIREFADPSFHRDAVPTLMPGAGKRILYLSSPIGLGHARRDIAIAQRLNELVPSAKIDWLAQDPVTRVLEAEGQHVHPASEHLACEAAHIDSEAHEHDLHVFQAWRRMDELMINNYMVVRDVLREKRYDLVVGDEAWETDYYLHENPQEKAASFAWFTDFVGWLPMPSGGEHERFLAADYNTQMIEHIDRHPDIRDRALFVGDPDDLVTEPLGPGLPTVREWTTEHFDFTGYITGFDPAALGERDELRAELGYRQDEKVCIVTVGGSGVGAALLRRIIDAYPHAKARLPELRMIVVAGPRIDPSSLPSHDGLEVKGYVHRLYRHLAACDVAVVQGGLTTTMELVANRRPFLYFPLKNHFEQTYHVPFRLRRHRAGRQMDVDTATPEVVADALVAELAHRPDYAPVAADGAHRAAAHLVELL
jgi:pimeloyl-ACP methyl ester carboxylesterase/predicted glycosyltransferase